MKAATSLAALLFALSPALAPAADDSAPANGKMKQALRARLAEDARKAPAAKKDSATTAPTKPAAAPAPAAEATAPREDETPAATNTAAAKPNPTQLPKVEVKKGKYSARDHQLALDLHAQDQAIERERKLLQTTETDLALNDSKVAKPLAIFGGESAQFRKRVAAERLELLEAEKDIIEQIAMAQTPEQKKLLQTQLDQLRDMRRQLDKSLR